MIDRMVEKEAPGINMAINDRIKQALALRNMKQVELVAKTGIDKSQISSYLSGKYKPKQENLSLIAMALEVDEYWLMGQDVPMERVVTGEEAIEGQMRRVEAYAKQIYGSREQETVWKLYERLSDEQRRRAKMYMEKLFEIQKMEESIGL